MILKDEPPRSVGVQYATGEEEIAPEGMKRLSLSRNDAQWWVRRAVKVKPDAVKTNTAQEPGMLGP